MSLATDAQFESHQARGWQLRFGLKTVLVFVTLFCVYLGYQSARAQLASKMVARRNSLLDTIIANVVPPPANSFYRLAPGSRDELERYLGRSLPGDAFQRDVILRTGSTSTVASQNLTIDVSRLLASSEASEVAQRLVAHYSQGLDQLGLAKRNDETAIGDDQANTAAIWTSEANELTVFVEARVDSNSPTALVRIQIVDAQQLHLW